MKLLSSILLPIIVLLISTCAAEAQQLIYQPTHPAFGGNPNNGHWILSSAQAQKNEEDPMAIDPLDEFGTNMQRQILNQITREIVQNKFAGVDLTEEGRHDLGEYIVEVIDAGNGTNIIVTDPNTGNQTTIDIPNY